MKVGDLVRCKNQGCVGIIVDWCINYDRFGDPVEKQAVVIWEYCEDLELEYMDALEVINESR